MVAPKSWLKVLVPCGMVSTQLVVLKYLLLGQVWVAAAADAMDTMSSALAAVGTSMTVGIPDVVGMSPGPDEAAGVLSVEYVEAGDATLLVDVRTEPKVPATNAEVVPWLED